jgi:hypothetical protein
MAVKGLAKENNQSTINASESLEGASKFRKLNSSQGFEKIAMQKRWRIFSGSPMPDSVGSETTAL